MSRVNRVSPGINTREINLTQTVNANSGFQSAFAGTYAWGPVDLPTLIDSENEQIEVFGFPNQSNFVSWFTSAEFLSESGGCYVTRLVADDAYNASLGGVGENGTLDTTVVNGEVSSVALNTGGTGYTVGDISEIAGGQISNAEVQILTVDGDGAILTVNLVSNGSGYSVSGTGIAITSKNDFIINNYDDFIQNSAALPEIIGSFPGSLGNGYGVMVLRASDFYGNQFERFFRKSPDAEEAFFDGDGRTDSFNLNASFTNATDVIITVNGIEINEGASPGQWDRTGSVLTIISDEETFTGDDLTSEFTILNANGLDLFTSSVISDSIVLTESFSSTGHVPKGFFDIDPSTGLLTVGTNLETLSGDGVTSVRSITSGDTIDATNVRVSVDGTYLTVVALAPSVGEVEIASVGGGYDFTFGDIPGSGLGNIEIEWGFPTTGVSSVVVTYGLPLGDEALKVFHSQTGVHAVIYDRDSDEILEKFTNLSTVSSSTFANGISNYYPEYVSRISKYIRITRDITNFGDSVLTGGSDGGALTDADYQIAYNVFSNAEDYDIQYLIDPCVSANVSQHLTTTCENRGDCVAFLGSTRDITVANNGRELASVLQYARLLSSSSYAIFNPTWIKLYDRYNAVERWVPSTGTDAGLYARTHLQNTLWTAAAGYNRGQYRRARNVSWLPSSAAQDELYANNINYVKRNNGVGYYLFGQKTLLRKEDAFNRANVRFLSIHIKKGVSEALKFVLFEINDEITRAAVRNLINPLMRDVFARRGVYEYQVKCDAENNPPTVIDANELIVQIYQQPTKTAEFIGLELVYTQTGISFEEVRLTN